MKKICIVTGSRAEFGLLLPLIRKIEQSRKYELQLAVTGMHLCEEFGKTENEVAQTGIPYVTVPFEVSTSCLADMACSAGEAVKAFACFLDTNRPDLLVVLGDRYEVFAASFSAAMLHIPIAHIHGGEVTQGAVDDFLRHSITKMSSLHFTACDVYRKRVIQLGESPDRVFNVGALGVENVLNTPPLTMREIQDSVGFVPDTPYAMVTFHPVTMQDDSAEQLGELIKAMEHFQEYSFVITKANADAGGSELNNIMQQAAERHEKWHSVSSLGVVNYLSLLRNADFVLGNSSSGIIEAPALHIPTVNVGTRQQGRAMAPSVLCCKPESSEIIDAVTLVLSPEYRSRLSEKAAYWGDGHTSAHIIAIIDRFFSGHFDHNKQFYDLEFEVPE